MMNIESLTWNTFKAQLQEHPNQILNFQYAENQWVNANYHITEIKESAITSVDCGGLVNRWTEIILQLWEPEKNPQTRAMEVSKALSIISLVESKITLDGTAVVKIEFGNSDFDTRQMYPSAFVLDGENLTVKLMADITQCKAIGRGESCGPDTEGEACCSTEPVQKKKIEMVNLASESNCCTPGGGCC